VDRDRRRSPRARRDRRGATERGRRGAVPRTTRRTLARSAGRPSRRRRRRSRCASAARAPLTGERRQQRRTGRRAQLPLAARQDGRAAAGEDGQDRRHRNGQRAVRRRHPARAEGDGLTTTRGARLEQPQGIERGGAADHVGERVERADFVQVDLLGVLAVDRRLGRAQEAEDIRERTQATAARGPPRQPDAARRRGFARRPCRGRERRPWLPQPVASNRPRADLDRLHAQSRDGRRHRLDRCTRVEQRAQQHVARRAGRGVDPQATAGFCHGISFELIWRRPERRQIDRRPGAELTVCTGWPGRPAGSIPHQWKVLTVSATGFILCRMDQRNGNSPPRSGTSPAARTSRRPPSREPSPSPGSSRRDAERVLAVAEELHTGRAAPRAA
jgi:hypothetical protein